MNHCLLLRTAGWVLSLHQDVVERRIDQLFLVDDGALLIEFLILFHPGSGIELGWANTAALGYESQVLPYLRRVHLHAIHFQDDLLTFAGVALRMHGALLLSRGGRVDCIHSFLLLPNDVCFINADIH